MSDYIRTKPSPFCPICGAKMVLRRPRPHQNWKPFWGCNTFPDCDGKRQVEEVNEAQLTMGGLFYQEDEG